MSWRGWEGLLSDKMDAPNFSVVFLPSPSLFLPIRLSPHPRCSRSQLSFFSLWWIWPGCTGDGSHDGAWDGWPPPWCWLSSWWAAWSGTCPGPHGWAASRWQQSTGLVWYWPVNHTLGKKLKKPVWVKYFYSAYRTSERLGWWGGSGLGLFVNLPQKQIHTLKGNVLEHLNVLRFLAVKWSCVEVINFNVFCHSFCNLILKWITFAVLNINSSFSLFIQLCCLNLHCDWPVELLRGLEGWAGISESAWHTNQAEFPMGTIEVNFLFWSFLVEE